MTEVTVYSTQACPWCVRAKEFLEENKVDFKSVDVGSDRDGAKEMIEKSGQTGVPVIDIGGEIIVGFNEPRLRELLKLK
ncbi:glutaredoxin family protein [Nanoarchaeota archaeon]